MRNSVKYVVSKVVSSALPGALKVALLKAITIQSTFNYGTMKLKAYEKIIWMSEFGVIYLLGLKSSLLVHPKSAL